MTAACALGELMAGRSPSSEPVRMHPADLEALAELVVERLHARPLSVAGLSQEYPKLMGTEQVMAALEWSRGRVATARKSGDLPARQVGKNWIYSRAGVEALLSGAPVPGQ